MHSKNVVRGKEVSVIEITSEQFKEAMDECLEAVSQGQTHIVHREGQQDVAVISIEEYALFQKYKRLLTKAARELLREYY